ncbi:MULTISPECIES: amino acid-binding protein [Halorussus]|uniref:amino acid-binding protein n=1 Tax=Halorussus TaxID=1070314 RepID=UPI00209D12BE|nr:amino acid-binding protein [Halorussus vallis]USZ74752.1 amino acid-binding protein [Halorussus vallis]
MSDDAERTDGSGMQAHTVRLELVDEPGELLRALEPIAANRGNLLSVFHERGSLTPRGHIPVEVDFECPPERFDVIVSALRDAGVNVIQSGAERYGEEVTVLLVGHLIETDLSGTLSRIQDDAGAAVEDVSLSATQGTDEVASARLRLAAETGRTGAVLDAVRDVAAEKDLRVVAPLDAEGSA